MGGGAPKWCWSKEAVETNTEDGRAAEAMIRQEKEGETVLYRRMGIPFALPGTPCCSSFLQELISKAASHICPLVPAGPPLGQDSLLLWLAMPRNLCRGSMALALLVQGPWPAQCAHPLFLILVTRISSGTLLLLLHLASCLSALPHPRFLSSALFHFPLPFFLFASHLPPGYTVCVLLPGSPGILLVWRWGLAGKEPELSSV